MSSVANGWPWGTRNGAHTARDATDPRLRGRTYAIPFERVWTTALRLANGGTRGWTVVDADDQEGMIRVEARTRFLRSTYFVEVRISLDSDGQTRVDAGLAFHGPRADRHVAARRRANARRLAELFQRLDKALRTPPRTRRGAGRPLAH
jgi:hypothetical protein